MGEKLHRCLLLKHGEIDPRRNSEEAEAQSKLVGFVTNVLYFSKEFQFMFSNKINYDYLFI